jgi:hypothetical protein
MHAHLPFDIKLTGRRHVGMNRLWECARFQKQFVYALTRPCSKQFLESLVSGSELPECRGPALPEVTYLLQKAAESFPFGIPQDGTGGRVLECEYQSTENALTFFARICLKLLY